MECGTGTVHRTIRGLNVVSLKKNGKVLISCEFPGDSPKPVISLMARVKAPPEPPLKTPDHEMQDKRAPAYPTPTQKAYHATPELQHRVRERNPLGFMCIQIGLGPVDCL